MCERTERAAVKVLARSLRDWSEQGNNPHEFDDDLALVHLVEGGIAPCTLSADIDYLIARAFKVVMRGGVQ